jgi:ATP-dependent Lon protease
MATALISALTRCPVRNDTAMTGEITLRGRVLAIGGLKDKTLAAHRQNIRRLIAPEDNRRDLQKIPEAIRKEMEYIFVSNMDQVIAAAILLDESQADNLAGAANPSENADSTESQRIPPPNQPVPFSDAVVSDLTGQ